MRQNCWLAYLKLLHIYLINNNNNKGLNKLGFFLDITIGLKSRTKVVYKMEVKVVIRYDKQKKY